MSHYFRGNYNSLPSDICPGQKDTCQIKTWCGLTFWPMKSLGQVASIFFKLHGLTSLIMPRTKGSPTVYRTKEVPQGIGQRKVPQAIGQRKCHRLNNVLQCVPYDSNLHRLDLFTSTHVHVKQQVLPK